jgi:hypothetical protein
MKDVTFQPKLIARQSRIQKIASPRSRSKSNSIAPPYAQDDGFIEMNYPMNSNTSKRVSVQLTHKRKSSGALGNTGPVFDRLFEHGENLKYQKQENIKRNMN